jgi:hypothetical protein
MHIERRREGQIVSREGVEYS